MLALIGVAAVSYAVVDFVTDRPGLPDTTVAEVTEAVDAGSVAPSVTQAVDNSPGSAQTSGSPPAVTTTSAVHPPSTTTTSLPPPPLSATADSTPGSSGVTTTEPTISSRTCDVRLPGGGAPASSPRLEHLPAENPAEVAIAISQRLYPCADQVIVAHPVDLYAATVAAQLAVRRQAPLLYYLPGSTAVEGLTKELERLAPRQVWMMTGVPDSLAPAGAEIVPPPFGGRGLDRMD